MYIIRRTQLSFALAVEKKVIRFRRRMDQFDLHPASEVVALHDESHHEQLFLRPVLTKKLLSRVDRWLEKRISIESE